MYYIYISCFMHLPVLVQVKNETFPLSFLGLADPFQDLWDYWFDKCFRRYYPLGMDDLLPKQITKLSDMVFKGETLILEGNWSDVRFKEIRLYPFCWKRAYPRLLSNEGNSRGIVYNKPRKIEVFNPKSPFGMDFLRTVIMAVFFNLS